MNILNGFNFMMPTQAAGAIVLDGNILIIIGFLALAYLLYSHRNELFDSDKDAYINTVDQKNTNTQQVREVNRDFTRTPVNNARTDINSNNVQEKEAEQQYNKNEKEVILNYR